MTTTNRIQTRDHVLADKIANDHGCDIMPGINGEAHVVVQDYWAQGSPRDEARIRECRAALEAAGVAPWSGHRLGSIKTPGPIRIEPAPAIIPVPWPRRR